MKFGLAFASGWLARSSMRSGFRGNGGVQRAVRIAGVDRLSEFGERVVAVATR